MEMAIRPQKCSFYARGHAQGAVFDTSAGFPRTNSRKTRLRELEVRDALVLLHVPQERLLLVVAVELHAQRGDDALARDGVLLGDQLAVLDSPHIQLVEEIVDGFDIDEFDVEVEDARLLAEPDVERGEVVQDEIGGEHGHEGALDEAGAGGEADAGAGPEASGRGEAVDPATVTQQLATQFDAVVISTGTPTARDLKAPGRELKGVHLALEMLSQQNRVLAGMEFSKDERVTAKGKEVLVIGGGDTGSDCIGTAHRQGCKSVTQIEIMPKPVEGLEDPQNPWPNWPRTLKTTSSHEEGCTRRWNINTLEFLGKDGKLTGVKVQEIDWKPNPEGGRPIMVEKGEPEIIKAELVLLAMGFLKPAHPEYPENVFVCGDAANGASLVVHAMASGIDTAKKIDKYLSK